MIIIRASLPVFFFFFFFSGYLSVAFSKCVLILNYAGETPILHAARQGYTETAKYLFEHGADPAISSNLGATALHHSAGIGILSWIGFVFGTTWMITGRVMKMDTVYKMLHWPTGRDVMHLVGCFLV